MGKVRAWAPKEHELNINCTKLGFCAKAMRKFLNFRQNVAIAVYSFRYCKTESM